MRAPPLPTQERRAEAVAAMLDLAAEQPPHSVTTTAIAMRMGLTQGALFKHFPTRDALLEAVVDWIRDALFAALGDAKREAGSPREAVRAMFVAHADFIARHPGAPRLLFAELQRGADVPVVAKVKDLLSDYRCQLLAVIDEGVASGAFQAGPALALAPTVIIGTLQGLAMQAIVAGNVALVADQAPAAVDLVLRMLEAP